MVDIPLSFVNDLDVNVPTLERPVAQEFHTELHRGPLTDIRPFGSKAIGVFRLVDGPVVPPASTFLDEQRSRRQHQSFSRVLSPFYLTADPPLVHSLCETRNEDH